MSYKKHGKYHIYELNDADLTDWLHDRYGNISHRHLPPIINACLILKELYPDLFTKENALLLSDIWLSPLVAKHPLEYMVCIRLNPYGIGYLVSPIEVEFAVKE